MCYNSGREGGLGAKGRTMRPVIFAAAFLCAAAPTFAQGQKAQDSPLVAEGDDRYQHGDLSGSIDSYSRAIITNPSLAPAYSRPRRSYRAHGNLDKSQANLD